MNTVTIKVSGESMTVTLDEPIDSRPKDARKETAEDIMLEWAFHKPLHMPLSQCGDFLEWLIATGRIKEGV